MDNTPIKLQQLVEEFHYFEDNQVLTATQLNTVVDYLDRRDRLTRVKLFGTGVICGLEVRINASDNTISISKGAAISSDGDLLHLNEATSYTHLSPFGDEKAKYSFFHDATERAIPLFRLHSEAPSNSSDIQILATFNQGNNQLGDMALVLYLNSYLEPPEECTEVDCENLGTKQKNELLPLLVRKSDLDQMTNQAQSPFFELPEVFIQRVDFHNRVITHEENLLQRYNNAIQLSAATLNAALTSIATDQQGYLSAILQKVYPNYSSLAQTWNTRLVSIFGNININNRADVLYIYNFAKDLAQAYNEFRETLFDLLVDCCPSPTLHPKHVMLGELQREASFLPAAYRHHFSESEILNHKDQRIKQAQVLHKRLDVMIQSFTVPDNSQLNIKITPSKQGDYTLGEKAIPYYYAPSPYDLHTFWNFQKTIRNQSRTNFGYRAPIFNGSPQAIVPLRYGLDAYNFYRIEGHLGKPKNEVETELERLKTVHNLNFKIVAVQIQDELTTIKPPRFRFPAIDVLMHDYRSRLNSDLSLVGHFNTQLKAVPSDIVSGTQSQDQTRMISQLNNSKQEAALIDTEIATISNHLKGDIQTFATNYTPFRASFNRMVNTSQQINENIYEFTQTKLETPLQRFVLDNQFNKFDSLIKYFNKKKEKVRQQYIFDKFYQQNPGMEHLSGVYEGGTIVLVYTSHTDEAQQRVVADFCITGCCVVEEEPEVQIEEVEATPIPLSPNVTIPPLRPISFIDNISIFKFPTIRNAVNNDLTEYIGQVNVLKDGLKDMIQRNDNLITKFEPSDLDRVNFPTDATGGFIGVGTNIYTPTPNVTIPNVTVPNVSIPNGPTAVITDNVTIGPSIGTIGTTTGTIGPVIGTVGTSIGTVGSNLGSFNLASVGAASPTIEATTFADPIMANLARNLSETGNQLNALSAIAEPTSDEKAKIKLLSGVFDDTAVKMVSLAADKSGDVDLSSDDAKVLGLINTQKAGMSDKIKLTKTSRKIKTVTPKIENKPLLRDLLNKF